jgi:hypothetical protein
MKLMTLLQKFGTEYFKRLLDTAFMLKERKIRATAYHTETWGFQYKISEMPEKKDITAYTARHCSDLPLALTVGSDADVEEGRLRDELISFKILSRQSYI